MELWGQFLGMDSQSQRRCTRIIAHVANLRPRDVIPVCVSLPVLRADASFLILSGLWVFKMLLFLYEQEAL